GGGGDDTLIGNDGDDTLIGGSGADVLLGGNGNDTVSYAGSTSGLIANLLTRSGVGGDAQGDTYTSIENVVGSEGNDLLMGDASANRLDGGGGNDVVSAGAGDDTLVGGAGDDTLFGGTGADVLQGATGTDTATYAGSSAAVLVNLYTQSGSGGDANGDTLISVERVVGSDGNDLLMGDDAANWLSGGLGTDVVS